MNAVLVLQHYKQRLAQEVGEWRTDPPAFKPLKVSRWVAMSLMQKAIRRGRLPIRHEPSVSKGNTRLKLMSQALNTAIGPRQGNDMTPEFRRLSEWETYLAKKLYCMEHWHHWAGVFFVAGAGLLALAVIIQMIGTDDIRSIFQSCIVGKKGDPTA